MGKKDRRIGKVLWFCQLIKHWGSFAYLFRVLLRGRHPHACNWNSSSDSRRSNSGPLPRRSLSRNLSSRARLPRCSVRASLVGSLAGTCGAMRHTDPSPRPTLHCTFCIKHSAVAVGERPTRTDFFLPPSRRFGRRIENEEIRRLPLRQ